MLYPISSWIADADFSPTKMTGSAHEPHTKYMFLLLLFLAACMLPTPKLALIFGSLVKSSLRTKENPCTTA